MNKNSKRITMILIVVLITSVTAGAVTYVRQRNNKIYKNIDDVLVLLHQASDEIELYVNENKFFYEKHEGSTESLLGEPGDQYIAERKLIVDHVTEAVNITKKAKETNAGYWPELSTLIDMRLEERETLKEAEQGDLEILYGFIKGYISEEEEVEEYLKEEHNPKIREFNESLEKSWEYNVKHGLEYKPTITLFGKIKGNNKMVIAEDTN